MHNQLKVCADIIILTHDSFIYDLVQKIAKENNVPITKHDIKKENNKWILTKNKKNKTQNDLINSMLDDKLLKMDDINLLIPRLFMRYPSKYGVFADIKAKSIMETMGIKHFNWSSQNIFHYEDEISIEEINKILFLNIVQKNKTMNSIQLLDFVEKEFNTKNDKIKYGLSFEKIQIYIKEIKSILNHEKKLLKKNKKALSWKNSNSYKNKNDRLNQIWEYDKEMTKLERDNIAHSLERDIQNIIK